MSSRRGVTVIKRKKIMSQFPNVVIAAFMSSWCTLVYVVERIKVFNSAITIRVRTITIQSSRRVQTKQKKVIQRCTGEKAVNVYNSTEGKERLESSNY